MCDLIWINFGYLILGGLFCREGWFPTILFPTKSWVHYTLTYLLSDGNTKMRHKFWNLSYIITDVWVFFYRLLQKEAIHFFFKFCSCRSVAHCIHFFSDQWATNFDIYPHLFLIYYATPNDLDIVKCNWI